MTLQFENDPLTFVDKNFVIRVKIISENKSVLVSAATLAEHLSKRAYINVIKMLLSAKWQQRTKKIRNRLIIDFVSK